MKEHVNCGGKLVFSHTEKTKIKRKIITKQMHECQKCGALINVIECPSFEEYVLSGRIRVSKAEYHAIKNQYTVTK